MISSHDGHVTAWLDGGPLDGSTTEVATTGTGLDEEIPRYLDLGGARYEITGTLREGLIVYRFAS